MSTSTVAPTRTPVPDTGQPTAPSMTHRQILEALSGLLLGMFVAILSSTVVSNALPTILSNLHGGESAYTWVVTATLLATTVTTPIWGKLSDLFSKKLLVQLALVIFVLSSAVAGLSQTPGMLIACRVFQGVGAGGLTALAQVVMAAMIAPRERGRYSGYLGATFALATVGGPLIGGLLVDTSWLGWRWCFYVGVPFAAAAIIVLQKTLHLPVIKREVKIDYWGAGLLTAGVSLLLIWVSLAGHQFDWKSWQTAVMVTGSLLLLVITVVVESRVAEPIIPIRLFRERTVTVATVASLFVGVALFGATVFLSQYFQISRGVFPTKSGLMTMPLILGLFVSSTVVGQLISRTGKWKRYLVLGGVLLTVGFVAMTTLRADTPYVRVATFMALIGLGVGMMMQNLVLAVQNTVSLRDLSAGSSVVAFFRSLGGAVGVSALGAVLSNRVVHYTSEGLAALGITGGTGQGTAVPDLATLPPPIRAVVQSSFGLATGDIFLVAAPFALLSLIAVLFIREVPLREVSATDGDVIAGMPTDDDSDDRVDDHLPGMPHVRPRTAPSSSDSADGLHRAGGISGAVALADDRRGVGRATVTVVAADGSVVAIATTDSHGRYEVAGLPAGTYSVVATATGPAIQATVDDGPTAGVDVALGVLDQAPAQSTPHPGAGRHRRP